jgi:hypothetical protein
MKTDLKNQSKEQKYLMDRLKRLEKTGKRMEPKAKIRNDPLQNKKFERKTPRVNHVSHKIDYEPHREKAFDKQLNLEKKREEIDLLGCTFNPLLDQNSLGMAKSKDHIIERPVPDKYQRSVIEQKLKMREQELADEELSTMRIPDYSKRKPDGQFYEKTTTWKKEKTEKAQKKLEEQIEKDAATLIGKPTLNKKSKELSEQKLGNEAFLNRLPKYMDKKKEKFEQLDKKYYSYPFKPELSATTKLLNNMVVQKREQEETNEQVAA